MPDRTEPPLAQRSDAYEIRRFDAADEAGGMATFERRKITQATFDECVAENVEEFEMDAAEALADAVEQFERQGVDLSGVDVSGSAERAAERDALREHVALLDRNAREGGATRGALEAALAFVGKACGSSGSNKKASASHRATLVAAGGLVAIGRLANACVTDAFSFGDVDVLAECLGALTCCVRGDADARDAFEFGGCPEATLRALKAGLVSGDAGIAARALALIAAAAIKTERVKTAFVKLRLAPLVVEALLAAVEEGDARLAAAAAGALVATTNADDMRSPMSGAYDASRVLVDAGAINALFASLEAFGGTAEHEEDAALGALDALRQIAKSDDAVKLIRKAGGARACLDGLRANRTDRVRCRRLAGLLRNMAGNDDAKDTMCKDGTLEELLGALERFLKKDATLCEHVVATLAQMALRRPKNATLIVEGRNGGSLVVHAMAAHKTHGGLMRQGSLAIRNFVGRNPEFKLPLLDAGAEAALRDAAAVSQTNVDVAFAALRDLGIDAKIKTFVTAEDGTVKEADGPLQFGAESNKNFRKKFEESQNVAATIARVDSLTDQQTKLSNFALM